MSIERQMQRRLWLSMALVSAASALVLLIPLWSERLLWLFAVLFWGLLIAGYSLLFLVDRWRRKQGSRNGGRTRPGIIRKAPDRLTTLCGVLAAGSLVFCLLRLAFHASAHWVDYLAVALFLCTVQLRGFLAGQNRNDLRSKMRKDKNNNRRSKKA